MPDHIDRNFSLGHLGALASVLEHGRISAASDALRRSPSAVSRSIGILEEKYGRALLVRSASGVAPTPEGELVAERCHIIQAELDGLLVRLNQAVKGGVRANAALFQMQVDVSRLRALIAVHDFGSAQRACLPLDITQPAVSASIHHLETDLGTKLFSRTATGMIATPAGVSCAFSFKRVLSELRKIHDDVDSCDGISQGLVCIGGLAYSRKALLPEAINRTRSSHPGIVVRTIEGTIGALLTALHAGEIDALICAQPSPALLEGVAMERIVWNRMGLFTSRHHPLAERTRLTAEEVLSYPFILSPAGTVTRRLLDEGFVDAAARVPTGTVETASYSIIRYLLLNSEMVAFRSIREFDLEMPSERIVCLDLAFELPGRWICLLQREGVRQTAAVEDFLDTLRTVAAD